jgi:Sec-independent protein secretion pathway component TatC
MAFGSHISEKLTCNLMGSRPLIAEPVGLFRMLRVPFVAFSGILLALLVIPTSVVRLTSGSYSPMVLFFIAAVGRPVLPAGWTLIEPGGLNEPYEIYLVASIVLALLVSSPIFSCQIMKSIAPALAMRKRTLYSLVTLASLLLAAGALFGALFLADYYLYGLDPFLVTTGGPPVFDAADFYFFVFRIIGSTAIEFTLPVYIYALIRFRSRRV